MDRNVAQSAERRAAWIAGILLLLLAAYVVAASCVTLLGYSEAAPSRIGIAILCASTIGMPWLAREKKALSAVTGSAALRADAAESMLCAYLSVIALLGLSARAFLHISSVDPIAAIALTPLIIREGRRSLRGEACLHLSSFGQRVKFEYAESLSAICAVRGSNSLRNGERVERPCRMCPIDSATAADCSHNALGSHADDPLRFVVPLKRNLHVTLPHQARELLSPFDQKDAVLRAQIVECQRVQLPLGIDAVKIDVIEIRPRPAIFMHQGKRRTGNVFLGRRLECRRNPLDQRGLAGSEIPS